MLFSREYTSVFNTGVCHAHTHTHTPGKCDARPTSATSERRIPIRPRPHLSAPGSSADANECAAG
eukprot:1191077-Prorocentrum_minimum.AAC.7